MPSTTLREFWTGPVSLGEGWRLHKSISGREREAVCQLWSHQFGWELRLVIDGGSCNGRKSAGRTRKY